MKIKDLFSHKIHSSSDDWPEKLIDIATIFAEFDGKPYDRNAIVHKLSEISPRASVVARDPSKFRDEISAYPAYLGLYRIELIDNQWHMFLSHTAKQFLTCEEPNTAAFMLLQLLLFQYPNGMGVAYTSGSDKIRIQANVRDRTLSLIDNEIHLSPLRLICKGLLADSILRETNPLNAQLPIEELFVLANHSSTNRTTNPDIDDVVNVLSKFRQGMIAPTADYESRFHILKHTNFLVSDRNGIKIRESLSPADAKDLLGKFKLINTIDFQFNGFDEASTAEDLLDKIKVCSWGKAFDGVKSLNLETVGILTHEDPQILVELESSSTTTVENKIVEIQKAVDIYKLREFNPKSHTTSSKIKGRKVIYTDPDITRIKRQRANLTHKILLEKVQSYLEQRGIIPYENEHIDLYAELLTTEKYVFEAKSINSDNLLSQTRKGISQLYEYRYRYQGVIGYDVHLCLVFPHEPVTVKWLQKYLCADRKIGIIWFDDDDKLCYSTYCKNITDPLVNSVTI